MGCCVKGTNPKQKIIFECMKEAFCYSRLELLIQLSIRVSLI